MQQPGSRPSMLLYNFTHRNPDYYAYAANCRRIRIFLFEKGLELPIQNVNLVRMEQKKSPFVEINPFGTIPFLELEDKTVISGSTPIAEFIEEAHPRPSLFGETSVARAKIRSWNERCEEYIMQPIMLLCRHIHPLYKEAAIEQNPDVIRVTDLYIQRQLRWFESHMMSGKYIVSNFSYADITMLTALEFYLLVLKKEMDPTHRNLWTWLEMMRKRASYKA